ncbi:hypothetical protein J2X46_004111 [Nocardioides sp. BE266]|uniref:hypothetical protein n=1 Tax=Nocardioides sp. BE266 TaxID=2817725 RepID=UPI0028621D48|nr:hypothetical protein [Nocardioides sp. BE266]MDR7255109.1 hypothetical protein [Nocardioides sp. BE266]
MGADEEAVAEVVTARTAASVSGDARRVREILAPDVSHTNASDGSCDREEHIASYVEPVELVWLETTQAGVLSGSIDGGSHSGGVRR